MEDGRYKDWHSEGSELICLDHRKCLNCRQKQQKEDFKETTNQAVFATGKSLSSKRLRKKKHKEKTGQKKEKK